ncbi:MAG: hypothetical protein JXA77_05700 [Bacteroidales bacterium]|nr:hypothetical protein [Bacteroidales bacterium]MBN2818736.1 hypothetical protein [Bacteroidales bacterium]
MKMRLTLLIIVFGCTMTYSQTTKQDSTYKKHFVSTSLWSVANLFPDPADFYELNYGYRITHKAAISVNATTWKYWEPLGIPLMDDKKYAHTEDYPGYVRAYGIGIVYQRFLWKQVYSSIHANTFLQNFYDEQNEKNQSGFQLYLQARIGYRLELFKKRFFLEPSLSFNYWPINTNFPASFLEKEKNWPNYFLFEPHLNFGICF